MSLRASYRNLNYIRIPLSKDQYTIIDREDLDRVKQYNWCAQCVTDTGSYYAVRSVPAENGHQKPLRLHNFIKHFITDDNPGLSIDHKNRDTLDNRKCNLRISDMNEQNINRNMLKNNTSGIIGVSYNNIRKCWISSIYKNNKPISIRFFGKYEDDKIKQMAIDNRKTFEKTSSLFHRALCIDNDDEYFKLDNMDKQLIEIMPRGNYQRLRTSSTTGMIGVYYDSRTDCHLASWKDEDGNRRQKSFKVGDRENGFEKSKQEAREHRLDMVILYPKHNKIQIGGNK